LENGCAVTSLNSNYLKSSKMVATKNHHSNVCALIHHENVDMTASLKKGGGIEKPTQDKYYKNRRKSSSPNCGGRSKRKTKQRRPKKLSVDQIESPTWNWAACSWESVGISMRKWVHLSNDTKPVRRDCYGAIRHKRAGEIIRVRDCVVIKSDENNSTQMNNNENATLKRSYVGKVAEFFVSPNGTLWASLVWYYWPEQAQVTSIDDLDVLDNLHSKELLASRHIDCVSVDSIESMAYVITINEYNRYATENKAESVSMPFSIVEELVPRAWSAYPRRRLMPTDDTDDAFVYFCRRVYDFHLKRLIRNPS